MSKRPSPAAPADYIEPEPDANEEGCLLNMSSDDDEWRKNNPQHDGRYPTPKSLRNDPRMPKPFFKTRCGIVCIILAIVILIGAFLFGFKNTIRIARLRQLGIPPGLYSRDGVLYVGKDTPFMIKGFSWFGMEEDGKLPGGFDRRPVDDIYRFAKEHNFNAIRLPLSVENLLHNELITSSSFVNPHVSGQRYIDVVKTLIQKAADHNILILLDMHRLENHEIQSAGFWYSERVPEESLFFVWKKLCEHVGDEWNVLGADIYNEPWDSLWNSPNKSEDWKQASERLGNFIHQECPSWTIVIEGVGTRAKGTKLHTFWSENLRVMQSAPPKLTLQSKVILSPHVYGPSVHMQEYFEADDFTKDMPGIWDDHFGEASRATGLATVIGEWGGKYEGKDKEWQDTFFPYVMKRKIPFFYWCLNPNSADTGGLLEDDWFTPSHKRLNLLSDSPSTSVQKHAAHFKYWRYWRQESKQ
eukprot:GFKZ01005357.1.p2 GENE.GFKZ01005357.1~~GFKZ01005357.1.p2  ORF type:complete len:470 (-),score=45.51 GFKZ01005357.1:1860-3269(-)